MTGYIYMVTCSETNKVYIGQVTHEYHRRFNRHIRTAFDGFEFSYKLK